MLTDSARRFGLVITAAFAITACGGIKGKAIDANPVYTDAGDDVGVVAADTGPNDLSSASIARAQIRQSSTIIPVRTTSWPR